MAIASAWSLLATVSLPIEMVLVQFAVAFLPIAIECWWVAPAFGPTATASRPAFGLTTLVGQILTALLVFISDAAIASCVNETVPITAPATADSVITATFLDLVLPFA